MFQVLDNPSLREEILKHVVFGKDGVDRKAASILRLVDRNWNESVGRILRKAHQHLFQLRNPSRKAVERFVSTFASSAELMGSVPPLAVHDFDLRWSPENLEIFSNCLSRCGDALIQLGFQTTENGRPYTADLRNLSLPCLHKLDIMLTIDFRDNRSDGPEGVVEDDQNTDNLSTCLIKSVLSNATGLSELSLNIDDLFPPPSQQGSQFTVFDSVILPPSITKIAACITRVNQPLEMLARSPLPNLTSLDMHISMASRPFSDGLIIRILENCRKSLKTFNLCGIDHSGNMGAHDVARFPVMDQLVTLYMDGVSVEPERGCDSLEKYFPKLATLHLPMQTTEHFQKWAGSSPVPGVVGLRMLLRENWKASLNVETMQRVNFVFPNLRKLEMTMSSDDPSGLEYIFREMRQLTDLDIKVECNLEESTSSDIWDSLLTGVPVEVIARSRADPDFWERNDMEDESIASIKNLTELKRCSLNFCRVHHCNVYIRRYEDLHLVMRPSVSDFVFNCALLRMPNLTELRLARLSSFNVSQEMIAKWRNDGRSLTIY